MDIAYDDCATCPEFSPNRHLDSTSSPTSHARGPLACASLCRVLYSLTVVRQQGPLAFRPCTGRSQVRRRDNSCRAPVRHSVSDAVRVGAAEMLDDPVTGPWRRHGAPQVASCPALATIRFAAMSATVAVDRRALRNSECHYVGGLTSQ